MIFSDLPSPAEASRHAVRTCQGFAQAGNRFPLFGIMLEKRMRPPEGPAGAASGLREGISRSG
jgi:hypothetical protein